MDLISSKGKNFAVKTKGQLVFLENNGRTAVYYGADNEGDMVDVEYRFDSSGNIIGYLHFHCAGRTWMVRVFNEGLWDFSSRRDTYEIPCSAKHWKLLVLEANKHRIVFTMV